MGTPNKKYVANNMQSLILILPLKGRQVSIEFKAGYGITKEGSFLTNDPEMQEALESDKRFNKKYRIAMVDNISYPEWQARQALKEAAAKATHTEPVVEEVTDVTDPVETGEPTKVEETTNVEADTTSEVETTAVETATAIEETTETVVKEFTLVQDAKDYLNKEFNVPYHEITSWEKVIAKATELGVEIRKV